MSNTATFDPWETARERGLEKVTVGQREFNKTLVDRAAKRVDDVVRLNGRQFAVLGNDKFKDTYPQYDVRWNGGDEYDCSCYALQHGDSRARSACSHVVAVMLYREQLGYVSNGDGEVKAVDGGKERSQESAPQLNLGPVDVSTETMASVRSDIYVPSINDPRFTEWDMTPLPSKFQELRAHQWDAVQEIMECYNRGIEVVFLDAPTGGGKTLISELVRRLTHKRAFYVCHSKSLQSQFTNDFPYAKLLMGRSNYPTLQGPDDVNCGDCTTDGNERDCMWCDEYVNCPYQVAKREAIQSKLAILNTAYFLTEFNYVGQVGSLRELGIIDECDTLESELMGFAEFRLGERVLSRVGLQPPKEGSHYTTLGKWLVEQFKVKLSEYQRTIRGDDVRTIREKMSCARLMADVLRIEMQIERDETLGNWVRDNKAGPFTLKPVTVGDYGDRYVWGHAQKWLCMSATIISADELSESCGLNGGDGEGRDGRKWEVVSVPMTFPVANRPIIIAPVADMSKKGKDAGEWEYAATALRNICARHPNDRVLVHTVSYELARFLMDRVTRTLDRPVYSYGEAAGRDRVLEQFRRDERSVLVAASMDRGVDLAGDDCRVVVVCKVPFPNLGDAQIGKRMRGANGQTWYVVQAVRKLVQMTGRAVRSKDDWCVTYVLDRQMVSNVLKKHRGLLPGWWKEALVKDFDIRELLK